MLPFELTKGELWSVFYEYFNINWPCYKGFLLYQYDFTCVSGSLMLWQRKHPLYRPLARLTVWGNSRISDILLRVAFPCDDAFMVYVAYIMFDRWIDWSKIKRYKSHIGVRCIDVMTERENYQMEDEQSVSHDIHMVSLCYVVFRFYYQWSLLLTWINFNTTMDK